MSRRVRSSSLPRSLFLTLVLCLLPAPPVSAQDAVLASEGYLSPPDAIREALLAPWHQNVDLDDLDPSGQFFLIEEQTQRMPPLSGFAKPHHRLGGLEIDPLASRNRRFSTGGADGVRVFSWRNGRDVTIDVPQGAKVSNAEWSPDGSRLAFFAHFDDATHIYVANPTNGSAERLTSTLVLATLVTNFAWSGDGRHLFTVLVPEGRGTEPVEPAVATTPGIWLTQPEENLTRTYPSLLETPHEFDLLRYHTIGQLARIDVGNGSVRSIGDPAMIDRIDPAPDGQHVRVRTIQEPFSKIVAVGNFATVEEIWDLDGNVLVEVAREAVNDGSDNDEDDAVERRSLTWRPNGQGLSFLQREPRPDRNRDADEDADEEQEENGDRKDRVMQWLPPFDEEGAQVVHASEDRINSVAYAADGRTLFVTTRDGDDEHLYAVGTDGAPRTIYRHDTDDFFEDPGSLQTRPGPRGGSVVRMASDGRSVYLAGTRFHENGLEQAPQPFVDRVALDTGEKTRIFESSAERYESVAAALDDDYGQVIVSRESPTEVPNFFLRDLRNGNERQVTDNVNYTPELTSRAQRHTIDVERADGVMFRVSIALPADYQAGTRLPAMFWHYPREYEDEESYHESNRRYNKNRFPGISPRSMDHLLSQGWAVVSPDVPIIAPDQKWNDYYVVHLRNSMSAAIDALSERGWIDRSRLAVGGHSYGGFGTLNSMIHTPYFKAGIAGASNTNRTLTPGGFQRERRTLWEGRETYIRMSPIFWLNELGGALLMYHDMEDQNVGTFPVNSWRAFHGLNALGKTAALYMYPYEAHGPRAEETILDMWTRWVGWLDEHVTGTTTPAAVTEESEEDR